jgi:GAF domain-containing protein
VPDPFAAATNEAEGVGSAEMAGARPELLSLLLSTDDIEVFLDNLARTASESLGASCAVTVRSGRMPLTAAHSDSLAAAVDEAQYEQGQGPCLHALDSGDIVAIPDVTRDDRWAGYHAHALAHGVRSSLSLPLQADGLTTGALNFYSESTHAFDDPTLMSAATALAAQGGAVVGVAVRQAQQAELTTQLREALATRAVIDHAIGILMAQQRCTADEAIALLRSASQNRNRRVHDLATDLVTAVGGQPPEPASFGDPK